jgi:hypothetical protein
MKTYKVLPDPTPIKAIRKLVGDNRRGYDKKPGDLGNLLRKLEQANEVMRCEEVIDLIDIFHISLNKMRKRAVLVLEVLEAQERLRNKVIKEHRRLFAQR